MKNSKGMLVISILTVVIGAGLLLNAMGLLPPIDWLWTLGLCIAGILTLTFGGINKLTVVAGPFLIFASLTSILRQTDLLPLKYEIPLLIIALGCLLFLVEVLHLPIPRCLQDEDEDEQE